MKTQNSRFAAALLALAILPMTHSSEAANEIGYLETYALAENRETALAQLIPGTEEHYYFTCLHHQANGDLAAVEKLLPTWVKRHGETGTYREIRHRQALLAYEDNPKASLDYLIHQLSLRFDHQKEELNKKPALPIALDAKQITGEAFRKRAFASHKNLNGLENRGLDALLREGANLDTVRRRHLLGRLTRPDFPNLVELIAVELKAKESRGFGEFAIHRALLPEQLSELLKLQPDLIRNANYVNVVASKLRPGADVNWRNDAEERAAYFSRLWMFAKELDPAFNAFKAHVFYQLLADKRANGDYDKALFMEYLKLPRRMGYVEPKYLEDPDRRRHVADLGADFRQVTACPIIANDEALVRDYFMHLFVDEASWKPYAEFVRESWLKPVFAEAKIVAGIGDQEKWYALLSPAAYEALKERVDLNFAAWNPRQFTVEDEVKLEIGIKNVRELIVKVYEVNALNYYLQEGREVNTDLQLDGLVANSEQRHEYDDPALRRVMREFNFPELANKRGTWVIEFIGNGRSSRALVRKGGLQFIARTTPAGTKFDILDLSNQAAKAPSLWLGGRKFEADEDGNVFVPYSTTPGRQPLVLMDGDFAALEFYNAPAEQYTFTAGFHIDAETLLPGHQAAIAVRPSLTLGGAPTTLALLEDASLSITSTDLDGITSTLEVPSFQLAEDRESTHEFRVPERLNTLHVTLSAWVQNVSTGERQQLRSSSSFNVNGLDKSEHVWMPHLAKIEENYVLELLGKTGEPLADVPLRIQLKHRDYTASHAVTLKSAANGQVLLGSLPDIVGITVEGAPSGHRSWILGGDYIRLPGSLHGVSGEALRIPYAGQATKVTAGNFALLERRGGSYSSNRLKALSLEDGFLALGGLTPGDYELVLKELDETLAVRITEGQQSGGYALGEHRHLEVKPGHDLQIVSIESGEKKTRIHLGGANAFSRVHLVATRYLESFPLRERLGQFPYAEPYTIARGSSTSRYLSGRDIGDEYRYIIERRGAPKFPGNMLTRPGLLLNPWAIRDTDTSTDRAAKGEEWGAGEADEKAAASAAKRKAEDSEKGRGVGTPGALSASLNFLANGSTVIYNLVPDKEGVVTIDTADLGDRQYLHVLAVDPQNTAYRQMALKERGTVVRDLRLANGLDPKGHFSEQKQSTTLAKGDSLEIDDVRTARVETYEDLTKVYTYLSALNPDPTLAEFRFLVEWPSLKPEQKREKYSKYACHELHFFLSRRDPEFFNTVVKPYLANKRDKTFMDEYLLGADLSRYLAPWYHGRLNAVEQILLAGALGGDKPSASARHIGDQLDLQPRDITRENTVFETAVKGLALSADGDSVSSVLELEREALRDHAKESKVRALGGAVADGLTLATPPPAAPGAAATPEAAPNAPERAKRMLRRGSAVRDRNANGTRLSSELKEVDSDKFSEGLMLQDEEDGLASASGRFAYFGMRQSMRERDLAERLFRQVEQTKEYAENNYYHRRITDQGSELVTPNAFWLDFAAHVSKGGDKPFLSSNFGHASRNFTEAAFALAVLELPFAADRPEAVAGAADGKNPLSFSITAAGPTIVFHREIKTAPISDERSPLLVAQNFFRQSDRYQTREGERHDKFVREEFLTGVAYGSQIAVTNPTSARQKLDLLIQIPAGALPCGNSKYTAGQHFSIEPYATQTLEFYFYFAGPSGEKPFGIFPAHAAKNEAIVAWAEGLEFSVVRQATKLDTGSWDYVSQHADSKVVLDYLAQNNPLGIDLARIAWRMRDRAFFESTIALLEKRHVYDGTLYSYGLHHGATAPARQFLAHNNGFINQCGSHLDSALVDIDPIERHLHEHLEYAPLINARAHTLGKDRKVLNDAFLGQYRRFLKVLTYKSSLNAEDRLALSYYLFLQDRIGEALAWFEGIDPSAVAEKLQHDYLRCYAAFYAGDAAAARKIAAEYAEHPVERWRTRFTEVIAHADEIAGKGGIAEVEPGAEAENQRELEHEAAAAGEPTLAVAVEAGEVKLTYRNVTDAVVNYYRMDLEFLFSTKPFLSGEAERFSIIKPNHSATLKLPKGKEAHAFTLPKEFAGQNVLVEIVSAGVRASSPYYANSLDVSVVENYGRVDVRDAKSGKPIPRAYVKVYARDSSGRPVFYKDGYTDLRGKFDYASLSTSDLDGAGRFALLIMSEDNGALVREATPPVR